MRAPRVVFGMNSAFAVRQFLPELLEAVRSRGLQPVVVAPLAEQQAEFADSFPGVDFRHVSIEREIAPLSDLIALFHMLRLLREIQPAVSDASTPKMGLLGGLAAWLAGVPKRIYTLRGLRYQTARGWKRALLIVCEKVACRMAHQVICISRGVRDAALNDGIAPAEKLALLGERGSEGIAIPTEPAIRDSQIAEFRQRLQIPDSAKVIGFVGRLTRDKGVCELVECVRTLQARQRAVHLLLLGEFERGDPVDAGTAEFIRTSPAVHWMGFVPNPQPFYRLMDLFVFPTYREGLPKVLMEAAAQGAPIVSTRATGVCDIIEDGLNGVLVPPGDSRALTAAVSDLLDHPEKARRLADAGSALIREHFDNSVYLARFASLMERLAAPGCDDPFPQPLAEVRRL